MGIIEIQGLKKSFGSLKVLDGINFSVAEGEKIVIIGESGCGKSIFLRCIELLEKPDAGKIFIDGEEITAKDVDINKIRQKMGMVYQKFNLFTHMNVLENLCVAPIKLLKMTKEDAEQKAKNLLQQVGLLSKINSYPEFLSGGQQQRIAICRALMMNPKIILFDEPTSALDPKMVGEVLAVIRMLSKKNLTMIIVTHEMNFAKEIADRILFFSDGGIYEQGTPKEIFENPKREKTISFIRRQKYFHFEIYEKNFDLAEMQGLIWNFSEKYGINDKNARKLQLFSEEIIFEMIEKCFAEDEKIEMTLDIIHGEHDKIFELNLICGGKNFDPFEVEEKISADDLRLKILKKLANYVDYSYNDGKNILKIKLNI